jgi:hypothetical protein
VTLYTSGNISTAAQSWYRVVLQASDGAPLGGDQYRIELTSSVSQTIEDGRRGLSPLGDRGMRPFTSFSLWNYIAGCGIIK